MNGGAGIDTAVYAGRYDQYKVQDLQSEVNSAWRVVATGDTVDNGGIDQVQNVEFIAFSDGYVRTDTGAFISGVVLADYDALVGFPDPYTPQSSNLGQFSVGSPPVVPPPVEPPPVEPTVPAPTVTGTAKPGETLVGTAGNDVFASGGGKADIMKGLKGDDTYIVDDAVILVKEAYDGGTDIAYQTTRQFNYSSAVEMVIMLDGAETVKMSHTAATVVGNGLANSIIGSSQDDDLRGGGGEDLIEGRYGDDRIDGGAGIDTAVYKGSFADYDVALNPDGSLTVADRVGTDGADTLFNVEWLAFADLSVAAPNGGPAASPIGSPSEPGPPALPTPTVLGTKTPGETVTGTSGNDVLASGGGSKDTLQGFDGDDTYIVDSAVQLVKEAYNGGADTAYLSAKSFLFSSAVETVFLLDGAESVRMSHTAATVIGNAAVNSIGGSSQDDLLFGAGGNDTIRGRYGDDTIDGGSGTDTAVFDGAASDYLIALNADGNIQVADQAGTDGIDTLIEVELLQFADGLVAVADIEWL